MGENEDACFPLHRDANIALNESGTTMSDEIKRQYVNYLFFKVENPAFLFCKLFLCFSGQKEFFVFERMKRIIVGLVDLAFKDFSYADRGRIFRLEQMVDESGNVTRG